MKQQEIAAQLYSFRDFIGTVAGFRDTLKCLRQMGYESVQLSSAIPAMPEQELAGILKSEGFTAPTSHEAAARLITEPQAVIDKLLALDCRHTAYPFPVRMPTGTGECIAMAEELNRVAEQFRAAGIAFAYHNHSHEFVRFNNRTMLELLYEHAPAMEGEIDTYWVQRGGGDPVAWIEKLSGRMRVIHLKDYAIKGTDIRMAPVGSGNLDWKRIIGAAKKAGVGCYVVEHDADAPDPFASFASSLNFLKENFVEH